MMVPYAALCDSLMTLNGQSGSGLNTVNQVVACDVILCWPVWFLVDLNGQSSSRLNTVSQVVACDGTLCWPVWFLVELKWTVKFRIKYCQPSCGLRWYLMLGLYDAYVILNGQSSSGINTISQVVAFDWSLFWPLGLPVVLKWTVRFRFKYCQLRFNRLLQ